jgi:hypothetical protein
LRKRIGFNHSSTPRAEGCVGPITNGALLKKTVNPKKTAIPVNTIMAAGKSAVMLRTQTQHKSFPACPTP